MTQSTMNLDSGYSLTNVKLDDDIAVKLVFHNNITVHVCNMMFN